MFKLLYLIAFMGLILPPFAWAQEFVSLPRIDEKSPRVAVVSFGLSLPCHSTMLARRFSGKSAIAKGEGRDDLMSQREDTK